LGARCKQEMVFVRFEGHFPSALVHSDVPVTL